jgi:tRNA dimethylallyltransferase
MLPLIILAGPTTSNKSDTAIELAEKINSEIISADSMQVYKYFNIGTAKVTPADRVRIPHHLIDILEPDQEFSAFDFKTKALAHTRELHSQGKVPIITGGTGLYIKALCEGYDCAVQINPEIKKQVQSDIQTKGLPEMHRELLQIDPNSAERIPPLDRQRIERAISVYRQTGAPFSKFSKENSKTNYEFPIHTFLIERDRKELYANINQRVEKMIEKGWVEEVKNLLAQGFSEKLKPFQSIGYAQIIKFLHEKQSLEKTTDLIKQDTRNYAKRQITWFKKLYDAKTINAESSDNPITLRDKILALIPQTLGLFAFFISLSFANPENVMGSEIRPYSSGLSQFQKGNFHQAALLFRSIHSSSSDSRAKKRASYLLAHSLAHTNKLDESIKLFLASIKSYPEIEDYIRFHLAEVFLNSGKIKEALEQVNTLHKNFPNTLLLTKSNILLAKILEKDNKIQTALNVLGETEKRISGFSIRSEYRSYLPEVIFLQGHLYQKLGKKNEAYDRYRLLHIVAPTNQLTQQAKGEMIKLAKDMAIGIKSLALNEYEQRTRALLRDVEYQQIVSEVSELLKHNTSLPANFYFYLARAQKGLRKRNLSNSALRKFLEHHPNHRRKQEALFMIGRNLWNTGYYRDGLKYFKNSIDTATNHTLANQARFFIGKMHEEKKRYPKATKYYTELVSKSSDEYAERAAWQLGWMNYTTGNFKKAYDYFDNSVRKYPSGLFIESSMFWSAKSAKQLKRMGLAQQIFTNVNMTFPYTYYGIRAGEMKPDKKFFPEIPREEEPPFATPILSTDAHFHHSRGVELSAIGFYEDARLEIKKLESTTRKNLSGVLWLTKLYNDAHAYSDTMRVMQLYKNFKTKLLEKNLTKNFWENFYPLAYAKAIRDNAKIFNVDPYFVKGLIRQESLFNSQVQSRAGAIGLMQIMPKTGRVLYANSTKSEPFNTTILFNPETNIQLGIQYIGQLNKRFKKNKTHILISYNAGPHNLKKWLKRFSHLQDPDVFIESIPYPETRKYVKKVLRNYGIYQSLYSKKNL